MRTHKLTKIRDTSLKAFFEAEEEGILSSYQSIVYNYLLNNPLSNDREIAENTSLRINVVTGRRNELLDLGLVESRGKRPCSITKRTTYQWIAIKYYDIETVRQKKKEIRQLHLCPLCKGRGYIF